MKKPKKKKSPKISKSSSLEIYNLLESAILEFDNEKLDAILKANPKLDLDRNVFNGCNLLHRAAYANNCYAIAALLGKGVDINKLTDSGQNAANWAINGFDISNYGNYSQRFNYHSLEMLIEHGININYQESGDKTTILQQATGPKFKHVFHFLITRGANPNLLNVYGENVLFRIARLSKFDNLKAQFHLAVVAGADLFCINKDGKDIWQVAYKEGNYEFAKTITRKILCKNYPLTFMTRLKWKIRSFRPFFE